MTIDTSGLPTEIADAITESLASRKTALNKATVSTKRLIRNLVKGISGRLGTGVFTGNSDELNQFIETERRNFADALEGIVKTGTLESAIAGMGIGAKALERQLAHQGSKGLKLVQGDFLNKATAFSKNWTASTRYMGPGKTWNLSSRIWDLSGNNLQEIQKILKAGIGTDAVKLSKALTVYVKEGSKTFVRDYPELYERMGGRVAKNINFETLRLARNEISEVYWESSVEGYRNNPAIQAVKQLLSNNRPKDFHDICDQIITEDLYGLGPGVFPVEFAPARPHTLCLCVLVPIVKLLDQAA